MQTYKIVLRPAAAVPAHMLQTHDGYEWLYVLHGRVRIQLGRGTSSSIRVRPLSSTPSPRTR